MTGHVTICFGPDGKTEFYPEGDDRPELARRLQRIIEILHDNPTAIRCAAGACEGFCAHSALGGGTA